MSDSEILDKISSDLDLIKKALKIVPDRETTITDFEASIRSYEEFARDDLKLQQVTIDNQKSTIHAFLNHSKGLINKQTVKTFLQTNESSSWKTNQVKALRKYLRDFLKLGRWVEEFGFSKARIKLKEIPSDEQLAQFCVLLPYQTQMIFLTMMNSGLRIGEVLSLRLSDIDLEKNMIDASNIHKGTTKSSWISFITKQASEFLESYLSSDEIKYEDEDSKLFSISARSVQQAFKNVSEQMGVSLNPHLLRTVFTEKCSLAKIQDKYINAFCGRVSSSVLAKSYTDYSPNALKKQYEKVEPYLILPFS